MGFSDWADGLKIVLVFFVIISLPCAFIAVYGAKMINDLGNFPTKSAEIQMAASWKILIVEIFAFALLTLFLKVFS